VCLSQARPRGDQCDDWLLQRYVPGKRLVRLAPMAMWIFGDEMGTPEITRDDAIRLMNAPGGKLLGKVDTSSVRGDAPTISAPV
jgi:hypothetical protein